MNTQPIHDREQIGRTVQSAVANQPVRDMHTHLYPPGFGTPVTNRTGQTDPAGLMLYGIDELLTYHYLVAEVFRVVPPTKLSYDDFWKMPKSVQADHIWKHLFVDRAPISEACRGVLTTITRLGLDANDRTLDYWRNYFLELTPDEAIGRTMSAANVSSITMTNNLFDDNERGRWLADASVGSDSRFQPVLRIDPMLVNWQAAGKAIASWGYEVNDDVDEKTVEEARRLLRDWIKRIKAIYVALSLPPEFRYPAGNNDATGQAGQRILEQVILPVCTEYNLPFAMMIGSRRGVNPLLRDAADMGGLSSVESVTNLCRAYPGNRFFVTMLARENQHELAVAARKFGNLMIFGCWWFLNNPLLIEEITRMRMELLGTSFIPQHSDCRVLEQLIYKWDHSRAIIAKVLTDKFTDMLNAGRAPTTEEIRNTVALFLSGNFTSFLAG